LEGEGKDTKEGIGDEVGEGSWLRLRIRRGANKGKLTGEKRKTGEGIARLEKPTKRKGNLKADCQNAGSLRRGRNIVLKLEEKTGKKGGDGNVLL